MRLIRDKNHKLTPLSVAGYFFMLCLAAKAVFAYGSLHPSREALKVVDGTVTQARIGGNGSSTWFRITNDGGTHRYSSYYGRVWPGMEDIEVGDSVTVRAERDKLGRTELSAGKQYYIWELIHRGRVIVAYDDVREMVGGNEATINRFANRFLWASALLLLVVYARKVSGD